MQNIAPKSACIFSLLIITIVMMSTINITFSKQTNGEMINSQEKSPHFFSLYYQIDGETFGEERTFWILNPNTNEYQQTTAKLLSVGQYCYIYVDLKTIYDIGEPEAISRSNNYSAEFDSVIYPTDLALVGHPDGTLGDIDGDPKITILITPSSYGGIYLFKDDNPSDPHSNLREMVYIHSSLGLLRGYSNLIHEFNHLIWFNHEQDEAIFVLEGTADYSRYKAGYLNNEEAIEAQVAADYNLTFTSNYFKLHPENSLLYWDYDDLSLNQASYGRSFMFMLYLSERFGEDLLTDLVTVPEDGPAGIEKALQNKGYNLTFNEIYLDWITACTIDLEDFEEGKFGFQTADFQISSYSEIPSLPSNSIINKQKLYGFNVKKIISPPDKFTLEITNPKSYALGISIATKDNNGWNITQTICNSTNDDNFHLYFSGNEIDYAYIIISMISIDTPYAVNFNYPRLTAPNMNLSLSFFEGYATRNSSMKIIFLGPCFILSFIIIKRIKK